MDVKAKAQHIVHFSYTCAFNGLNFSGDCKKQRSGKIKDENDDMNAKLQEKKTSITLRIRAFNIYNIVIILLATFQFTKFSKSFLI